MALLSISSLFAGSKQKDVELQSIIDYSDLLILNEAKLQEFMNASHSNAVVYYYLFQYYQIANDKKSNINYTLPTRNSEGYETYQYLYEGALLAKDSTKYTEALAKLEDGKLKDKHKKNIWIRIELYFLYNDIGDNVAADKNLNEALKMDSNFNIAILEKIYSMDFNNSCAQILNNCNRMIKNNCKNTDILYLTGAAEMRCGDRNKARTFFENSIKLKPNFNAYWELAEIEYYYEKNYKQARIYYELANDLEGSDQTKRMDIFNIALAWFYYDMMEYEKAEYFFKKELIKEDDIDVYTMLIQFYFLIAKFEPIPNLIKEVKSKFDYPSIDFFFDLHYKYHTKVISKKDYLEGIVEIIKEDHGAQDWIENFMKIEIERKESQIKQE